MSNEEILSRNKFIDILVIYILYIKSLRLIFQNREREREKRKYTFDSDKIGIWTKEDAMQEVERERGRKGYARVKAMDRPRPKTTSIYHGVSRVTVPGT